MKTNKLYSYAKVACCAIWLLAGCVRQSVPECRSDVQVSFRYVQNMSGTDLFAAQVHKLSMLVFDANNVYAGSFTDQGDALAADGYMMRLSLAPGTYTLLVWGGWLETYDIAALEPGVSTLADFRLWANGLTSRGGATLDIPGLDELFHGICNTLKVEAGQTASATIDLMKDTSTLWFTVTGLEYLSGYASAGSDPSPFDVEVWGENGTYGADNLPRPEERMLRYLPTDNADNGNTLNSLTRVLRLMLDSNINMKITLRPSGRTVWEGDVIGMITSNPLYASQQQIDLQDLFHFEYRLDADANITVVVNGWTIINAIPIL